MPRHKDLRNLSPDEWFSEIDQGLEYRRLYGIEESWNDLEALYYNTHDSQASDSPNLIAATGDSFLSELTVPKPYIRVDALRGDSVNGAPIVESVVNTLLYDMEFPTQVEDSTLHAYLWGRGTIKLGFDSEFGWDPGLDLGAEEGFRLGMSLSQFDKTGKRIEFGRTRPGMPWGRACLPHDIVVPWGTVDSDEAPWLCHRIIRHVDDVRADPKYGKPHDLQPCMSMEDYVKSYQSMMKPYRVGWQPRHVASRKAQFCELWELHSRRTGEIIVLATGSKKFLRKDRDYLQTEEGYPFVSVSFVPRSRNFWVTPDAYYLRYHQAEQTDIALQASKQRRMSVLRFGYQEDAIDDDEVEKLVRADVGAGFKTKGGIPIKEAVAFIQPGNNMMLWQDAAQGRRNADEVVGFSRNDRGEFEQGRRTATEVRRVARGSGARMGRRVSRIKRLYEQSARKLVRILSELWKAPRVTQILGPEGEAKWLRFTGRDLRGKFRYTADFTTEAGDSLQQRRQQALFLYSQLAQDPMVDPVELRRYLVSSFNDPSLGKLFRMDRDADLRLQMQQMQAGGGAPAASGGARTQGLLPSV